MLASQTEDVAWALRETVKRKTEIIISVGAAPARTLAKVANHIAKQGTGVAVLDDMAAIPDVLQSFLVAEVWGVFAVPGSDGEKAGAARRLDGALDAINKKIINGTVRLASTGLDNVAPWKMSQKRTSPRSTTEWGKLAKVSCK